jgi:hypothetical protein
MLAFFEGNMGVREAMGVGAEDFDRGDGISAAGMAKR